MSTTPERVQEIHAEITAAQRTIQHLAVELRRHIAALREAKWSQADIAKLLGVTPGRAAQMDPVVLTPRLRPIEACPWTGTNWETVKAFCGDRVTEPDVNGRLWLRTVHGPESCDPGDTIIKGIEDYFPVSQNVLVQTYEVPDVME